MKKIPHTGDTKSLNGAVSSTNIFVSADVKTSADSIIFGGGANPPMPPSSSPLSPPPKGLFF